MESFEMQISDCSVVSFYDPLDFNLFILLFISLMRSMYEHVNFGTCTSLYDKKIFLFAVLR